MASDAAKFPINGGTYAPYGVITDDNHGSFVIIATWIFGCISVLFVVVRVILRTWTSRHFGRDNGLIVAALVRQPIFIVRRVLTPCSSVSLLRKVYPPANLIISDSAYLPLDISPPEACSHGSRRNQDPCTRNDSYCLRRSSSFKSGS